MPQAMKYPIHIALFIFCVTTMTQVFATGKTIPENNTTKVVTNSNSLVIPISEAPSRIRQTADDNFIVKTESREEQKEKEKAINDINTFLIESYKLKIDKILSNLNISIERITNKDQGAQKKLLQKIRADIAIKIQVINSRNITENRKKILSTVFLYIQENLDDKISKLTEEQ
jgi:dihydroorotase